MSRTLEDKNLGLGSESRHQAGDFSAGFEGKKSEATSEATKIVRERLDNAVAKNKVTAEIAKTMNERIEAIEAGKAPAADTEKLTAEIERYETTAGSQISQEMLAGSLNGNIDLVGAADAEGAGYEAMNALMAQTAKNYGEKNQS